MRSPRSHGSSIGFIPASPDSNHQYCDANDDLDDHGPPPPELDDIKVEYHSHSQIPSTIHAFSDFSRHRPTEDSVPRNTTPWEPFRTRLDFEVAEIALAAAMPKDLTNRFLDVVRRVANAKEDFTLQNHDEIRSLWEMASARFTPVSHSDVHKASMCHQVYSSRPV
jgi:hypothetical protein